MQLEPDARERALLHQLQAALDGIAPGRGTLRLGLAVSGGSDSVAMLHLFAALSQTRDIALAVVTVDHGLRPEARQEAAFVAEICARYGLSHECLEWSGWDGQGNLQAEARAARYHLLANWAHATQRDWIALGHTEDDLAETFLMRLARGSGLDGLAAMDRQFNRAGAAFFRPLLGASRQDLRLYLTQKGHGWQEDPSNADTRFQRVSTRQVLTGLEPLGLGRAQIANAARRLSAAKTALQEFAREHAEKIVTFQGGDLVIGSADWRATHPELQRRLMNAMLQWAGDTTYAPRADAVADLDKKLRSQGRHTLNGCVVSLDADSLRVAREYNAVSDMVCEAGALWDGRWLLEGPGGAEIEVRALGETGLLACPNWRDTGLPRRSLLASPAVWTGPELVAAPLAGLANGWCARLTRSREQFLSGLLSH